jgi:enterochelin esterase family protein
MCAMTCFKWVLPILVLSATVVAATEAGAAFDNGDIKLSPPYVEAPELKIRPDVPKGTVHDFVMDSADSPLYPGVKGPYKRKVAVYIPKQYVAGAAAPFIVAHDGFDYLTKLPPVLDNLIADRKLPAMIAILLSSGGGDGPGSERGLEYDTVSEKYTTFVETEVLPRVAKEYHVTLTTDPEGRASMGGSSGGAAAFTMAWFRPDLYRRILTYSGTYVNRPKIQNCRTARGSTLKI